MKFQSLIVLALIGFATCARVSYEGYKVYEVNPKNVDQALLLKQFQNHKYFDFWSKMRKTNKPVSVMVAPIMQNKFEKFLDANGISNMVLIPDVEKTIQRELNLRSLTPRVAAGNVSFTEFLTHEEINAYLQRLAKDYPAIASVQLLGKSYEGRDILALTISSGNLSNPTILVDAGIHAREWIAPSVALYIINQLVENPANSGLYRNVNWVVIPSLNPDGYAYTFSTDRYWRKTRSKGVRCYGTDPNRNFGFHWKENGASSYECDETYAGIEAFSEPETRALRDYILAKNTIVLYLTFHSYGQYLLYPWGYTSRLPDDVSELDSLAQDVNRAIRAVRGTRYEIGSSTNVLYAAAGGSDDYAKGVGGVELSYTIELPGGGWIGFDPPASDIIPVVEETWQGVLVYHDYIQRKFT